MAVLVGHWAVLLFPGKGHAEWLSHLNNPGGQVPQSLADLAHQARTTDKVWTPGPYLKPGKGWRWAPVR